MKPSLRERRSWDGPSSVGLGDVQFIEPFVNDAGTQNITHALTTGIAQGTWTVCAPITLDPRSTMSAPHVVAGVTFETPNSDGVEIQVDDVAISFE